MPDTWGKSLSDSKARDHGFLTTRLGTCFNHIMAGYAQALQYTLKTELDAEVSLTFKVPIGGEASCVWCFTKLDSDSGYPEMSLCENTTFSAYTWNNGDRLDVVVEKRLTVEGGSKSASSSKWDVTLTDGQAQASTDASQ